MKKFSLLLALLLAPMLSFGAAITVWTPGGDLAASTTATNQQLATTGVGAGSVTLANLTIDAKGRITVKASSTYPDIVSKFSGTCTASATRYLATDGTCQLLTGGTGTVTSVDLAAPSIFTVSGNPVTTAGTLTLTANGTSGGIPYFSASNALSSSAALTANRLVLGGGAGVAPTILGSLGTTTTVLHGNAAGAPTFAAVSLTADVSGRLPYANFVQGAALSLVGNATNALADNTSIVAASDFQVMRRSGTALAFGAVNLASANAVTGTLPDGNLSSNIPLKNAANVFTANQSITMGAGSALLNLQGFGGKQWSVNSSTDTNLYITNTTDARDVVKIIPAGNVTINAPSSGTPLTVNSVSGNPATLALQRATQGTGQVSLGLMGGTSGVDWLIRQDTSSNVLQFVNATGGVTAMTLDTSGNLVATGNVTAFSDARLKTNVEIIPDALNKVEQLRGVTFNRIDTGARDTGLIAQDLQKVLPEAVQVNEGGTLSVAYGNVVGLLVESIKELKTQNDELYERIKVLEGAR